MSSYPRALAAPLAALLLTAVALPAIGQQAAKPQAGPAAEPAKVPPPATAATRRPVTPSQPAPTLPDLTGVDRKPWLFEGSDIRPDPEWYFGKLPNGLRYAVRRNGVPPGQVAVRVRIDAGSLNEQDPEQGYAHLIEHLSFRGSKYVPDGEAKRVWQRFGATFGSDSNASTTPTQTVYKLDLPAATQATLDESLKIFSGMMAEPAITAANLATERPAVMAEQREAPGPQVRYGDKLRETFFAGQPLATRSPIGTVKTLDAATPASVQAFHDRWYRPARAVVIISGDIDPELAQRLVVKNFGGWQGKGANPPDTDFGKPGGDGPATAAISEPSLPPMVAMATLRPWTFNQDTILFNQKRMVDQIAVRVIARRLETRARAGGSFLQANISLDDVSRSANGTFTNVMPIGDDWGAALKDVRAVIADAMKAPPSQAEIDRELAEYDVALRTGVETAKVEAGAKQADDMVEALDIRETVAGPQVSYEIFTEARKKGMFTPDTVFASTKKVFTGDVERALVNTRTPNPTAAAELETALKADVSNLAGKRRQQANIDFSKLPKLGKPATVKSRVELPGFGMEKIEFSNGVRMLLYANQSEPGRVYLSARWGRGYQALPTDRDVPVWAGDVALVASGIGKLDQGDLDQITTGRRMGMDFGIADDSFSLSAMTSPTDYKDNLRLMATKLAKPRWDAAPVARARAAMIAGYAGYQSSPDGVLSRDLNGLLRDGDPRWTTPSEAEVQALDAKSFKALWDPLLKTGPIEVMVFGDVKADEAIAAVAQSFGAMPPRAAETGPVPPVRFPAHVAQPVVRTHDGPDNQAAAVIAWPTAGGADRNAYAESRRLEILALIFGDRLFDRLRSVAGASYSPTVQSQWPAGQPGGGRIVAVGQVSPDKVGLFFQLTRQIASELATTPVDADELARAMKPMENYLMRASTGSPFWMQRLAGGTYDERRIMGTALIGTDMAGITPADLQAIAKKYLRPDRDWTLAVLPAKGAGAAGVAAQPAVPVPAAVPAPATGGARAPAGPPAGN